LPAIISVRKIRALEPALIPHVEVPDTVIIVTERPSVFVPVLITCEAAVTVVSRLEVGDTSGRDAQSAAQCCGDA